MNQYKPLYWVARRNSDTRLIPFTLTMSEFEGLVDRAQGRCMVTGIPFEFERVSGSMRRPFAPSLDRIDSSKGYSADNVRLVCVLVNLAMNEWGLEPLMRVARNLVERERDIKSRQPEQKWEAPVYYTAREYLGTNAQALVSRMNQRAQRYCEENGIEYITDAKTKITAFPRSVLELVDSK